MPEINYSELKPGTIIVYHLRPEQLPTDPMRDWRGKVKSVYDSCNGVRVEVLNEGFEGEEEPVYFQQIVRIEHAERIVSNL